MDCVNTATMMTMINVRWICYRYIGAAVGSSIQVDFGYMRHTNWQQQHRPTKISCNLLNSWMKIALTNRIDGKILSKIFHNSIQFQGNISILMKSIRKHSREICLSIYFFTCLRWIFPKSVNLCFTLHFHRVDDGNDLTKLI